MKTFLSVLIAAILFCTTGLWLFSEGNAATSANEEMAESGQHGLSLSDMTVSVTSSGNSAMFRLYDTVAAKQFYDQLPLSLDLSNFRDAQWMFYPPKKLSVTPQEAYHDGKKGELSYYEPWGDVFMLYKDFYAGDEMHRLGVGLTGIDQIAGMSGRATIEKSQATLSEKGKAMRIQVSSDGNTTVFKLNGSKASQELYDQLPLEIKVENYGGIEKIFYPPKKLDTADTPQANAREGTLAYYAPWGDVVMFYKSFGKASGLYELGEAISGSEHIQEMSGTVRVEKGDAR